MANSLRSFRLVCKKEERPLVEALLKAQGYDFEPEPFSPWVRRITCEPKPLGSSLAAFFGYIYIQDRSSMLPPLALIPAAEEDGGQSVLDMCASPGSKTGFVSQLVGKNGFVLGNEPNHSRLATLRQNLANLNLLHSATCSYGGENLPLPSGMWQRIQLDPPCSGWGTVEKNPQVMDLWQGDKVKPLIGIQRLLLQEATRLLRPGGSLVYSTCTTNEQENEEQVRWVQGELGLEVELITPFDGFVFETPYGSGAEGTLRVNPEASDAQGFYIARLHKPETAVQSALHEADEKPFAPLHFQAMHRESLRNNCLDPALLPDGEVANFADKALFLSRKALELLPQDFRWRGFPLGKRDKTGRLHAASGMRALMPSVEKVAGVSINTDDITQILSLLSGQSIDIPASALGASELGLYFMGLPLGRLKVKGKRALWAG